MSNSTYLSFYLRKGEMFVYHNAILAVGSPKCVRFRVKTDGTSMLMEAFDKKTFTSFRVPKIDENDGVGKVRIYSKAFTHILATHQNWDCSRSYRVPGRIMADQKMVLFDLTKAEDITMGMYY